MTMFRKVAGKSLATLGIAGLAVAGLAGAAFADDDPPVNTIDPDAKGSLTLHKNVSDTEGVAGVPLNGVTFELYSCDNDLTAGTDWSAMTCVNSTLVSELVTGAAGVDGQVKWENLAVGLYEVKETTKPAGVTGSNDFLVTIPFPEDGAWNYDVVVYPKNEVSGEAGKTLTGVDDHKASWELKSYPLGSTQLPASSTKVEVTDNIGTCMADLTNVKAFAVVDGTTTEVTPALDSTGAPTYVISHSWAVGAYPAGTYFKFTYDTTVNTDLLACQGVVANDSSWGHDASYWGKVDLTKVDGKANALDGAKFALYAGACPADPASLGTAVEEHLTVGGAWASAWYLVGVGEANAGAKVDYCVVETAAPTGYVLPAYAERSWTVELGAGLQHLNNGTAIVNTQTEGPDLPKTGASGTMLMVTGGVALVALAGGLYLVTRRKTA